MNWLIDSNYGGFGGIMLIDSSYEAGINWNSMEILCYSVKLVKNWWNLEAVCGVVLDWKLGAIGTVLLAKSVNLLGSCSGH